jgi:hypothetical protein
MCLCRYALATAGWSCSPPVQDRYSERRFLFPPRRQAALFSNSPWAKGVAGLLPQGGRSDVAKVLEKTLKEEKAADKKLTTIAESKVNLKAA